MISAVQSAAGGMAAAQARFTEAAVQVARMEAGPTGTGLPDAVRVDLSRAAGELAASRAAFAADAAVARRADATTRRLLDVRA